MPAPAPAPGTPWASFPNVISLAMPQETGLTHLYTVEANYNTARALNLVVPATGGRGLRQMLRSGFSCTLRSSS